MYKICLPMMFLCYMFITPLFTEDINEHRSLHYDDDVQITATIAAFKRPTEIVIREKNNHIVHNINEFISLEEPHSIVQENQQSKQDRFQLPVQYQSSYLSNLLI
ncbi:hypothetical protein H9655_12090 [Cytobacillus sp. Sa5YUA1]|uniref:Uncharacterized protein n=1 Tax=Cytobacillus stercorigallinarum TaxID=2762240 RepID=A0ABR8QR54_9BACI|nr:hypothetical protein [Cytobacillus stercorigallinarum]MBD7937762.1 hypothetical protein [Cytobacillus stercorigallinarum]